MGEFDKFKNSRMNAEIKETGNKIMAEALKRKNDEELDDLQGELRGLERRRDNFFDKDDGPHNYGDQGYQDIANRIGEIQERVEELRND